MPDRRAPWEHFPDTKPAGPAAASAPVIPPRRRRPFYIAGRVLIALISVIVLVGNGFLWSYMWATDSSFAQVKALDENSKDVVDAAAQAGDENFLIVGVDTRAGANAEVGAGTEAEVEGARSDVMMVVHIPKDRSRVVVVNFPRDLEIDRPLCLDWDNDSATYSDDLVDAEDETKLNTAYQLGGPSCLVRVIQKLTGMQIGHFVGTDFVGFEKMVDTIGGVELCTEVPLIDFEIGPVLEKTGPQIVSGKTALNYVRARQIEAEGNGDYGRIKRQQLFLGSLLRSVLSQRVLLDPSKLNDFIAAFTMNTFVEKVTTADLFTLAKSLRDVRAGAVTFITVPTDGTSEWGNEIPRTKDIEAIFRAIRDNGPLPGEKALAPLPPSTDGERAATIAPGNVAVTISNASGSVDTAQEVADQLSVYGFGIGAIRGYSGTSARTLVRFTEGYEAEARTLASAIPDAILVQVSELDYSVELVIGTGFKGRTTNPVKPGTVTTARILDEDSAADLPPDLAYTNAGDESCA